MRKLRLFHFDIKTYGNYGDTLLFEAVRQTFNGFAGGRAFEVYDSRPLRDPVGPALVDYINANVDAIVVGGGGLFLRDTNPNQRSGWQWNISVEQLKRIEVPIVVFSVGNNRFIGQDDFAPPFHEHVNLTMEKSVFFGLRNHGSVNTIKPYIAEANRDRVVYQPCPTTISSHLFPDLWQPELDPAPRLGVQMVVGKRQKRAGFDPDGIYGSVLEVLRRVEKDGWSLDSVPHARADEGFARRAVDEGPRMTDVKLWGDKDGLYRGVEYFAGLPMLLGTRGHGQMVPFGMGSIPVSLHVHHKTGYFATDIGHPEWAIDPRADGFEDTLYATLHAAHENRAALREELTGVRERMFRTTLDNLATIYRRITGESVEPEFTAYTPFERRLSDRAYAEGISRARADATVRDLRGEVKDLKRQLARAQGQPQPQQSPVQAIGAAMPPTMKKRLQPLVRTARTAARRARRG